MNNKKREQVSLSNLTVGMTVELHGTLSTVSKGDLKYDSFMGYSFRGASYPREVTVITFPTINGGHKDER